VGIEDYRDCREAPSRGGRDCRSSSAAWRLTVCRRSVTLRWQRVNGDLVMRV
jgi:hypothetical protein